MTKYSFGDTSTERLNTCSFPIQQIMREALAYGIMDFSISEGARSDEKQHEYFIMDKSRLDAGDLRAKHNRKISSAVDAVPYVNGKYSYVKAHCCVLAGIIQAAAKKIGYTIRWGGNWDMDGEPITDQDFQDLVHYEEV